MTNHTFTISPPFGSCNKSYLSLKMKPKQASFMFCRLREDTLQWITLAATILGISVPLHSLGCLYTKLEARSTPTRTNVIFITVIFVHSHRKKTTIYTFSVLTTFNQILYQTQLKNKIWVKMAKQSPPHNRDRYILPVSNQMLNIIKWFGAACCTSYANPSSYELNMQDFHKTSLLIPLTKFFCWKSFYKHMSLWN